MRGPFGQIHQSKASSKILKNRLAGHMEAAHSDGGGIPEAECQACKSLKEAIEKAEKREGLRKK